MIKFCQVAEACDQMGQLGVTKEVYQDLRYFTEDEVCVRIALCYDLVMKRLYQLYDKGADFAEIRDWLDEVVFPSTDITLEILCHGILAEYFLQTQDFVCCKMWDDRFESELAALRLKKGGTLPVGRWI